MDEKQFYTIIMRHDTSTQWAVNNPILTYGEYAVEDDTHRVKRGDGETEWNDLPYEEFGLVYLVTYKNLTGEVSDNQNLQDALDKKMSIAVFDDVNHSVISSIDIVAENGSIGKLTKITKDIDTAVTSSNIILIKSADNSVQGYWSTTDEGVRILNLIAESSIADYEVGHMYYRDQLCYYKNRLYRAVEDFEAELNFNPIHWVILASKHAEDIHYDNLSSELDATDVQGALDELKRRNDTKVTKTTEHRVVYGTTNAGAQTVIPVDDLRTVDTVNGKAATDQESKNIQIDANDINYDDSAETPETIKEKLDQKVDKTVAGEGAKIVRNVTIEYNTDEGHIKLIEDKVSLEDGSSEIEETEVDVVSEQELADNVATLNSTIENLRADVNNEVLRLDGRVDDAIADYNAKITNLSEVVANNKVDIENKLNVAVTNLTNYIDTGINNLSNYTNVEISNLSNHTNIEISNLSNYTNTEISNLSNFVNAGYINLSNDISNLATYTNTEISNLSTYTNAEISNLSTYTNAEISNLSTFTNAGISNLSNYVNTGYANLTTYIDNSVNNLSNYVNIGFNDINTNITSEISNLSNYTNTKINNLSNYINIGISNLSNFTNTEISNLSNFVNAGDGILQNYIDSEIANLSNYVNTQDNSKIDKDIADNIVVALDVATHDSQPTIRFTSKSTTTKNPVYDYVHFGTNGRITVRMEDADHLIIDSSDIDTVDTQQNARLTTAEGRLDAHDTSIASLIEHDLNHDRVLATHTSQIADHETRMLNAENDIDTLETDLDNEVTNRITADANLSTRIADNVARIANNTQAIRDNADSIDNLAQTLEEDVESLTHGKVNIDFAEALDNKIVGKIESDEIANTELFNLKQTMINPGTSATSIERIKIISSDGTVVATRQQDGTIDLATNLDTDVNYFVTTDTINPTIASDTVLDMTNLTPTDKQVVEVQDIITDPDGTWGRVKSVDTTNNECTVVTFKIHVQAVWGAIGGTLANQLDLQGALDSKIESVNGHTTSAQSKAITLDGSDINVDETAQTKVTLKSKLESLDNLKLDKVSGNNKIYGTDSNGNQTAYDKDSFGKVDTVNNVQPDANKNVTIGTTDIASEDIAGTDTTLASVITELQTLVGNLKADLQTQIRAYSRNTAYTTGGNYVSQNYVTYENGEGVVLMAKVLTNFTSDNTEASAYESFVKDVEDGNLKLVGIPEQVNNA